MEMFFEWVCLKIGVAFSSWTEVKNELMNWVDPSRADNDAVIFV